VPNLVAVHQILNLRPFLTSDLLPYFATRTLFHAASAFLQVFLDQFQGKSACYASHEVMLFKAKAFRVLQEELAEQAEPTDAALMTVVFLAHMDVSVFNNAVSISVQQLTCATIQHRSGSDGGRQLHKDALKMLISMRGGLSAIDPYVSSVLVR
jgi:hypothetical protein